MPEAVRLQIRTSAEPESWSNVGPGAEGVPVPVEVETLPLPAGSATAANQTDGSQKTQIVDASGNPVSVTDGKLDVNSAAPVGGATSANQDTLNALIETLQELSQRLAPPAGAMSSAAALRVAPISSVSTAVTGTVTATGPITSAQSIAEKAAGGISFPEKIAITNLTAVQSNINNCVGA